MRTEKKGFSHFIIYASTAFFIFLVIIVSIKDLILPSIIQMNIPVIRDSLLSLYNRKTVVRQTLELLSDPNIEVKEPMRLMMEKPQPLDPFIEILEDKSEDEELRSYSAFYLGFQMENKTNNQIESLLMKYLYDDKAKVRKSVVCALGEMKSQKSVPELIDRLIVDTNKEVKSSIISVLGEIGDKRAFDPIASHLCNPEPAIRQEIGWALARIDRDRAQQYILILLRDNSLEVRRTTLCSLNYYGDKQTIKYLREFENDKEIGKEVRDLIEELKKKKDDSK